MKLRLRLLKTNAVVEVEEDCTLTELQAIVSEKFMINEFKLSLNGKDALEIDDKKLNEHDIVSGDLIKILTEEKPSPEKSNSIPSNEASTACLPKPSDVEMKNSQEREETDNQQQIQTEAGAAQSVSSKYKQEEQCATTSADNQKIDPMEDEDCIQDNTVNRYLNEPMLIRDSTADQVPQSLRGAFRVANVQKSHYAMVPVLHILMTEVGFTEKDKPKDHPSYIPIADLSSSASFRLTYKHTVCEHSFAVMYVPVGPMLVIHGTVTGDKEEVVCQLQLKSDEYISDLQNEDVTKVFKDLPKLSRLFKDAIAYPLLQRARMDLGESQENTFSGLITELKITILSYLDLKSLLAISQSCSELHELSQEPALWRRLYLRNFGRLRNGDNDLQRDWQKMYKEKHLAKAQLRQRYRAFMDRGHPLIHRPVPLAPLPFGPVYPPGGIGGDYDRDPNFGGFPGARGPPLPGAMFPPIPRPRFDPFGPGFPGQNFRPGRGGGIWEEGGGLRDDFGRIPNRPNPGGRLGSGRGGFGLGFGPRFF